MRNKKTLVDVQDVIAVPDIKYKMVPEVGQKAQFTGTCVPIPAVLLEYLDRSELRLFGILLMVHRRTGKCTMRLPDLGKQMGMTHITVSKLMKKLQGMGIISLASGYGRRRNKVIHFDAIQKLHDYLEDMKPGAASALRKKMKSKNVAEIPPSIDLYMRSNYAYSDDEVENEEYD